MKKLVFLLFILPTVSFAEQKPFDYMDVFELEWATDPQIRGDNVIYVRNFMDIMKDRRRSNIWQIDSDGNNHRPMTTGLNNMRSPRLSPDGSLLAYLSNESGKTQIMMRFMDSGETFELAQLQNGASNISWSPDGSYIAFTAFAPKEPETYAPLPSAPKGAEWAKKPVVYDKTLFTRNGSGYGSLGNDHIFVVPALGGTARQITSGEFNHSSSLSWAKDGSKIYFSANRHDDHIDEPQNSEIYSVDVNSGEIVALTDRFGADRSPAVSPDGEMIAYLGFDDVRSEYHNSHLYVMNIDGSNKRMITDGMDINVESIKWTSRNNEIYIAYSEQSLGKVAKLSFNGRISDVTDKVGGTSVGRPYGGGDFDVDERGNVAFTIGSVHDQSNIAVAGEGQITDLNADLLPHRKLASVEEINYKSSHDNIDIQGWLMKPADFDASKKYPLILEIHGGPISHYGPYFAAEMQLMASAGYMVLYVNQRGSTSYGEDFANLLHHNYPNYDYDDVMSGVDHVIGMGNVDEDRLYIAGGSNGGILSSWAIGKTDRFKAAAVIKPLTNWVTGVLNSALARFSFRYEFADALWDNPEEYWKRSPLSLVGNVTTPTMLMTGEEDVTTPIGESEQYYQALKMKGVETILVRIPGAGHGIANRPSQLITKTQHTIKWFDDHK
ncbi:S9 family peptidase [Pseudemcibacter aquimaris]|uniref:S9 family peptidase n=1 Tax=Pseudemcibacter aquimaris TaxID=2857064 RepID=UPI00201169EB|nr:S9 family peptidase [Pseudemcibacter aquimaris]MCC3859613.1 S9 family peptidase [Pseudemcibacter aquimaris]WDU60008.1 S9 family peptidase [Pseudemcibacter aquimaris]